ncbi:DUF302 domain-containing protein [Cognatishimia sp. F0-27]|uniref:DUF302 domain-containing protein n=1 Tax=Cognatishimia sp. F0-27 TaxID=2816855 RepID=UPI001D0C70E4|nr:DUF302 domain-containing protein [Cognatishimia sp. F0-27]MCC1492991.1 DUF302 domain-containing protein [Cognatishimia sp. F0-27]
MQRKALFALALVAAASPTLAADRITYETDQSFDDVIFGLESAILDAGLVIDSVSHVGAMLERTRSDLGSDVELFDQADVYSFCSAVVSRSVMEADPMNVIFCPYDIFVVSFPETPNRTTIGFRTFPEGAMKEVEAMLDGIARAAIGLE